MLAGMIAEQDEMLNLVATIPGRLGIAGGNQKRVEEIYVVVLVVNDSMVGVPVTLTQGWVTIDMMRMPVAQMLKLRVFSFQLPKHLLLMCSVLKQTRRTARRVRSRLNDTQNRHR